MKHICVVSASRVSGRAGLPRVPLGAGLCDARSSVRARGRAAGRGRGGWVSIALTGIRHRIIAHGAFFLSAQATSNNSSCPI